MNRKLIYSIYFVWYLLVANTTFAYTHADTLRGSNGKGRSWWDVQHYDLSVNFDTLTKSIHGENRITFKIAHTPCDSMQIDLQEPMIMDKVQWGSKQLDFVKEGNVWWVKYPFHTWLVGDNEAVTVYYHGSPRIAVNPPWDGGFIWTHDSTGKPWIAVACQGLGASVWWPCKDAQWDEPDSGMDMHFAVPNGLTCVSNGRFIEKTTIDQENIQWHWRVKNPINNYDVTFYIGDYVHWHDTLMGEKGKLDLDFYALRENEAKAHKQFEVVKQMIHCFEYWMGPYPFYEDGYKLVEAPYLGMEHQSAIAYGNKYLMGYLGYDRSGTDVGMNFDYIIVHESGHEWFGNSITANDIADNWIHEGITTYSETLFAECLLGKDKAEQYNRGEWKNIKNDKPIIGSYGVNNEGSGDMYDKGTAIMYMVRKIINDNEKFREILRGLGQTFYRQMVTTQQVEQYISTNSGIDFTPFFNQYLRTTDIPELEYYVKDKELYYRFNNVVAGFVLPLGINTGKQSKNIHVTGDWQHIDWEKKKVAFSKDFLMTVKE